MSGFGFSPNEELKKMKPKERRVEREVVKNLLSFLDL
jgi:hypothetical protein